MDIGILITRVLLAVILGAHSTQKALGWFNGPGLKGAQLIFAGLGHQPARPMVLMAVVCELGGSLLLLLGLATPLAAAVSAGTLAVAAGSTMLSRRAFWNSSGGGEYPLVLAILAVALGFTGPGSWSVDHAIGTPWLDLKWASPEAIGFVVLLVAAAAATPPLVQCKRNLSAAVAAQTQQGARP